MSPIGAGSARSLGAVWTVALAACAPEALPAALAPCEGGTARVDAGLTVDAWVGEGVRQAAEDRLLAELLGGWGERHPDVVVHRFVERASPAAELLRRAEGARLVVTGARGRGGFTGLLLGSTSQALIHHAPCPVLVARAREGGAAHDGG